MLFLMIVGGCAGSTSGGMKVARVVLLYKFLRSELQILLQPLRVRAIKIKKTPLEDSVLFGIFSFSFAYFTVMALSILLVSFQADNFQTAIGSVVASIGNVGPGFGRVGSASNYSHLGSFTKWILSADMVMGCLEILTVLVLLMPETWRRG